jgi:tetratricopeptide (TPR) repeat protein
VRSLVRAGHVHPVVSGARAQYSFQDLLVLRTASALRAANIPTRKITRALTRIRETLTPAAHLNALSISSLGQAVTVREGSTQWESDSRQYALPLEIESRSPSSVSPLRPLEPESARGAGAQNYFEEGLRLEDSDGDAARAAYRACLKVDPHHLEARINLGRLLHVQGEAAEAEHIYRGATESDPMLSFNLAIVLEDLDREEEAMQCYRDALALDPALADAHFNLARLHERAQRPREALRHLLAYRRLLPG